uniref:N-alpha-acetyltransferase 60 n=1 Tax=Lepeophtheirus salmonis TaxID=72036 RepID=D3PJE2_LEPSM|nr:N-acetyltransferase 15 [Lepeophtheirus salmonis]
MRVVMPSSCPAPHSHYRRRRAPPLRSSQVIMRPAALAVPLVNSHELRIRFIVPEDVPVIQSLCKEWFPIEYPDSWFRDIATHRYYSVAAVKGDEILGILVAEIKDPSSLSKEDREILSTTFLKDKIGYILSLGVAEKYRRMGIASFLLDNLTRSVHSDRSAKALYLHVLSTNFQAISFYEKRGFRPHLFLPYYYAIKGKRKDGFTYVLYINGGHPPWTLFDYATSFCSFVIQYGSSLLSPWNVIKKVKTGWLGLQPRLQQITRGTTAVFL